MATHTHHIIPRHMGGTDDPDNLIELTIEEHAEAHRKLWEEHGKKEDFLAWKMLSRQWSIQEFEPEYQKLILEKQIEAGKKTGAQSFPGAANKAWETKRKNGTDKAWNAGLSKETDQRMKKVSDGLKKAIDEGRLVANIGDHMRGKSFSEEHREKLRQRKLNAPRTKCSHCGKEVKASAYSRWHGDKCKTKSQQ